MTTPVPAQYIEDLLGLAPVTPDGIVSRTLHSDDRLKIVLFVFDAGQELSEHTAAVPATVHILQGRARLRYDAEEREVGPGAWLWMPARMPHSLLARSPLVMLLSMHRAG